MTKLLQTLTPAESLLIRKGDLVSTKNAMKYTLLDLIFKEVLALQSNEHQAHPREPVRVTRYVMPGRNFKHYPSLTHERYWLIPFESRARKSLVFSDCIQIAFENAGSEKEYLKGLLSSHQVQGAFKKHLLQYITGGFDYTDKGFSLRLQLEREIEEMQHHIPHLLETDREKAMEQLRLISGNIFLLEALPLPIFVEIEREFMQEIGRYDGASSTVFSFDVYNSDFDNAAPPDSDDGSGDSGCGGDSGCSGCGGCGGD